MAVFAFLSVFGLYLSTLYPCIAPEDSGEFAGAAWSLGIPHASGYSLYVLLGKAACLLIPLGNPAYRVNILSAVLGAAAVPLLAKALQGLLPSVERAARPLDEMEADRWKKTALWAAALLWALAPGVWYLSLLAEVYILELFLGALLLWALAKGAPSDPVPLRGWALMAFLLGLGLGVHHTLVLWVPGLLLLFLARHPAAFAKPATAVRLLGERRPAFLRRWKALLSLAVLFAALGLSVQLFLYFRAQTDPVWNTGAPDNGERWLRVLFRRDYGTFSLFKGDQAVSRWDGLGAYFAAAARAFTPVGLALALWGARRSLRQARALFWGALLLWLIPGPLFILLANPPVQDHFRGVIERFYPLSLAGMAVFLAWGLWDAGQRWPKTRWIGAALIPLALAGHLWVSGRGNLHARDFGVNLLKSLPPGSVLWDPGDSAAYAALYAQRTAGLRPDVAVVLYHTTLWGQRELRRRFPDLLPDDGPDAPAQDGFQNDFLPRLLQGPRGGRVFTEVPASLPGVAPDDGLPVRRRYPQDGFPLGLTYRYFPSDTYRLVEPQAQLSLARLTFRWYRRSGTWRVENQPPAFPPTPLAGQSRDAFTAEILRRYAEAYTNLGQKFAQYGLSEEAEQAYHGALTVNPSQMEAHNNLGVLAYQAGDGRKAAALFQRALAAGPESPGLWVNLGLSRLLAQDPSSAAEAFQNALRLQPDGPEVRRFLAEALEAGGRREEALEQWKTLRKQNPEDKEAYWRLAQAQAALGRRDEARATLGEYALLSLTEEEKTAAEEFRSALAR